VLLGESVGELRAVGTVSDTGGEIAVDDGVFWLLGFDRQENRAVRRVELPEEQLGDPVPLGEGEPVTVLAEHVLQLRRHGRSVRATPLDGSGSWTVELPPVAEESRRSGSTAWFQRLDGAGLVSLDVLKRTVGEVPIDLDLAARVPRAEPPSGLAPSRHDVEELASMRRSLLGEVGSGDGGVSLIEGVTFESVTAVGSFPRSEIVALFRSVDRPGVLFGRRWPLYDALGNPESLEYAEVHLEEDVEGWPGLPLASECRPDADGVVWF